MKMLPVLVLLCLVSVLEAHVYDRGYFNQHAWKKLNFVSTVQPRKGEMDIRVARNGLLAMEAVVPRLREQGIFFREVTNGKTFLQLVYQNRDALVDCDLSREPTSIDDFVAKFFKLSADEDWREMYMDEIVEDRLQQGQNVTFQKLHPSEPVPEELADLLDFEQMKYECKELHKEMRNHLKADNAASHGQNPRSDDDAKTRSKRSMFIYPGTNWCGKGSTASNYYDLGENIETDKCCRAHDYCSVIIEGLSSNYNYFNYRLHTLSHCECDDQFHTCLKTSGDDVSKMVGNLFFNVIGNKCFVLKQTKVCMKRSWWGKCEKWKKQSQAELRGALEY